MYFCSRKRLRWHRHFLKGVPRFQTSDCDHDIEDDEIDNDTFDLAGVIPQTDSIGESIGDCVPNRKDFKVLVHARPVARKDGTILLKRRIVYVSFYMILNSCYM